MSVSEQWQIRNNDFTFKKLCVHLISLVCCPNSPLRSYTCTQPPHQGAIYSFDQYTCTHCRRQHDLNTHSDHNNSFLSSNKTEHSSGTSNWSSMVLRVTSKERWTFDTAAGRSSSLPQLLPTPQLGQVRVYTPCSFANDRLCRCKMYLCFREQ